MGANGTGANTKLVVNLVLSLNRMALAEGLTLAAKAGLDQAQALKVLKQSAAYSQRDGPERRPDGDEEFPEARQRAVHFLQGFAAYPRVGCKARLPIAPHEPLRPGPRIRSLEGKTSLDPATIIDFYRDLANLRTKYQVRGDVRPRQGEGQVGGMGFRRASA